MLTRVMISGLERSTLERLDRILGGSHWRFDTRENGHNIYDVDVSTDCDVLYSSNAKCVNTLVLSVGELTAGLKIDEFNSIIGG